MPTPNTIVVLDNGGASMKAGVLHANAPPPPARIVPNAVVRSKGDRATYVGHEFEEQCRDRAGLGWRLPIERGYIVDWDAQKAIWDGLFSDEVLNINPTLSTLLITEPYFNLPKIQDTLDQFVWEEYEFAGCVRATPASFIPHGQIFGDPTPECILVIDSGFSFTHVVPLIRGRVVWEAVKRLDIGGKLLTNHLTSLVSFRQWNMTEETYVMNHVKEACCYVSQDFGADLEACRVDKTTSNPIVQEYVLPDLTKEKTGRVRNREDIPLDMDTERTEQVLTMGNERFSVPEVIFHPGDIGLEQGGIAETVAASIALIPDDLRGLFWANIALVGGSTKFVGFRERLLNELCSLTPPECGVVLFQSSDAILDAYNGALAFATDSPALFATSTTTRAEYLESGSSAVRRRMGAVGNDWAGAKRLGSYMPEPEEATAAKGKGKERGIDGTASAPPVSAADNQGRRITRARPGPGMS